MKKNSEPKRVIKDQSKLFELRSQQNRELIHRVNMIRVGFLLTSTNDYKAWFQYQNSHLSAFRKKLRQELDIEKKTLKKTILEATQDGTLKLSSKEMNKYLKENTKQMNTLMDMAYKAQVKCVKDLTLKRTLSFDNDAFSKHLSKMTRDISEGKEYAVYKNNKKYRFEAYQDMAERTMLKEYTVNNGLKEAKESGNVFFITNYFDDCAKDHLGCQMQRVFITENWEDIVSDEYKGVVQNWVNEHPEYLTVEQAMADDEHGGCSFCLRPNCRHYLSVISIEDVVTQSPSDYQRQHNLIEGNGIATEHDRATTAKQRYFERQKRKFGEEYQIQKANTEKYLRDNAEAKIKNKNIKKSELPHSFDEIQAEKAKQKELWHKWRDYNDRLDHLVPDSKRIRRRENYQTM